MTDDLIQREEWGARYDDGFRDRPLPVSEFWLHHSVTIAPDLLPPFTDDDAAVRTLERIGESRFGGGISYTFAVTPVGRLYEGHSFHRQGAHTKGHNTVGAAFVLVGDYSKRAPTDEQRDTIARRMVRLHRTGKATRHTLNGGHRDASGNSTACPGDAGHAAIADINRRANILWAAGYPLAGGGSTAPIGGGTTPKPTSSALTVDGKLGTATIRRWQKVMGTPQDGVISRPSTLVKAVQRHLNTKGARLVVDGKGIGRNDDGDYGPTNTVKALQRYLGTTADGVLSHPSSNAVKALQRRLNTGKF